MKSQTPSLRARLMALLFPLAVAPLPGLAPLMAQALPVESLTADADPVAALSRYLRMLSGNPRDLASLTGAGRAALAVGDANAALGFYARAEEIAPRNGRIKAGLASALVQMEQPRTALRLFGEAVALGVPVGDIASDRGLANDLNGDNRRAQSDYTLALRARDDDETLRRLALSMAISGDRAGALTMLDPLLRKRDSGAARARAFVLALTGDQAGATNVVRGAMPGPQANVMANFMARLTKLNPAQKALAVNFGYFPSDGRSYSAAELFAESRSAMVPAGGMALLPRDPRNGRAGDTPLIPQGEALGPRSVAAVRDVDAQALRRRPGLIEATAEILPPPHVLTAPIPGQTPPPAATLPVATAVLAVARPAPAAVASTAAITTIAAAAPRAPSSGFPHAIVAAPQVPPIGMRPVANAPPGPAVTMPVGTATAVGGPGTSAVAGAAPVLAAASGVPYRAGSVAVPAMPQGVTVTTAPGLATTGTPPAPATLATAAPLVPPAPVALAAGAPSATAAPAPAAPPSPAPAVGGLIVTARGPALVMSDAVPPASPVTVLPQQPASATPAPVAVAAIARVDLLPSHLAPTVPPLPAAQPAPVLRARPVAHDPASARGGTGIPYKADARDRGEAVDRSARRADKAAAGRRKPGARDETAESDPHGEDQIKGAAGRGAKDRSAKAETRDRPAKADAKDRAGKTEDGRSARADAKDRPGKAGMKGKAGKLAAYDKADDADAKVASGSDGRSRGKKAVDKKVDDSTDVQAPAKSKLPERYWVQVASGSNKASLDKAWGDVKGRAPKLLTGKSTYTAPWHASNRLLIGPFKSEDEAQVQVNKLAKAGVSGIQFTTRAGNDVEKVGAK